MMDDDRLDSIILGMVGVVGTLIAGGLVVGLIFTWGARILVALLLAILALGYLVSRVLDR